MTDAELIKLDKDVAEMERQLIMAWKKWINDKEKDTPHMFFVAGFKSAWRVKK